MRLLRIAFIGGLVASIFSYLDARTGDLGFLEQPAYGLRLEVAGLMKPELNAAACKRIAVVGVTDSTYIWAARGGPVPQYLPRTVYAALIDALTRYGARVIALDINFHAPAPGDAALAAAIQRSGRVLDASFLNSDASASVRPEQRLMVSGCRTGLGQVSPVDGPAEDDIQPVLSVAAGPLHKSESFYQFSVAAVRMSKGDSVDIVPSSPLEGPIPGERVVTDPRGPYGSVKIRYLYGETALINPEPFNPGAVFTPIPVERVLSRNSQDIAFDRSYFPGKIVFVGDMLKVDGDFHPTPIGDMYGVLINANAAATLVSGSFIRKASEQAELTYLIALVLLTTWLSTTWPLRRVAAVIVSIVPLYCLANLFIFVRCDYYVHLAATSLAILLSAFWALLERVIAEENDKANFRSLLQRYVNPKIANLILKHPELIGEGGKRAVGTVLFCDVRGFTELSEALSSEQLVSRMNDYFQVMMDIVFRHDGMAVSFAGDALLAVFGIPVSVEDHADRAVAAGIEMLEAAKALREKWRGDGVASFTNGIGINTGEVIFGEIGGSQLRSFTVYGLQVNIAQRIEEMNKPLHTEILMSDSTRSALRGKFAVRGPVSVKVRGVQDSVIVYEVCPGEGVGVALDTPESTL